MRRKAQEWIYNLSDEDITFIKNFVMSSGSLKEVAKLYHITYPTVRLRLDRLIQKMQMNDQIFYNFIHRNNNGINHYLCTFFRIIFK